uniref:uncharacterized protein LOC129134394 n=1 Tax=Agelaius phoeniceus TaxID=39638 RepID=UPI0023EAA0B7|nr:uncharacterized protein LOC129134394 [Agelaius phoeniceus]
MKPLELSPALLQPQDSAGAILGQLLATLSRENETLLGSAASLSRDTEEFTRELRATLYSTDDTWRYWNVTNDCINPLTFLSQALAAYDSTQGSSQKYVRWPSLTWYMSPRSLKDRWAELAKKATKLCNTCRNLATEAADRAATATAWARELQAMAAMYGTPQEHMGELGQALGREEGAEVVAGREAWVRTEARVAASEATRATMERQRLEAALGLLEHLVAACDGATAFPEELERLAKDMEDILEGRKKESSIVPEALVAKVAEAERLWEASARQAVAHLVRTVPDAIKLWFTGAPTCPSACGVAERCQRATEDIPRLLRTPESPQSVPRMSPLSLELQELSPALLQPQVTVVATLGELLATLPRRDEEMLLPESAVELYRDLEEFTRNLRVTLYCTEGTWWRRNVTSDDGDPVPSLSQALAACRSTPGTTWDDVTMAASKWQLSVSALVDRWIRLAKKATELRRNCSYLATEAANREATATARARELQAEAARDGTAQEHMGELGQALGREEGAEVVAGCEAQVSREAGGAASLVTMASRRRQRLEAALGLLERLVAACDEATAFPRELQWRLRDTENALKGTNEASPDVPEDLVAKVAEAERLWEANARLAKDHLVGALGDIIGFYFDRGPTSARGVAERCQRATEDIPRLLQVPECPQSVPKICPVSLEPQELSPALLQPQVTVVATLGELLATLPRRGEMKLVSAVELYWDLVTFTESLRVTLYCTEGTWWHRSVTSDGGDPVPSLSRALDACRSTPAGTTWDCVTMAASEWQGLVAVLVNSWARLARAATKLRNTGIEAAAEALDRAALARELQDEADIYGTAQEHRGELGQALGREEDAYKLEEKIEAWVAAREATRATMVRQRLEAALGLLERLVPRV